MINNMKKNQKSIFKVYFENEKFIDRFKKNPEEAVDVIIPIVHTNELWEKNLISIYREIPVKRLLISDGGCIDDSIKIANKFPRVKIFDHKKYVSLGYCIRKLIEEVKTDWFIYLHSDVYLPKGWFEEMCKNKKKYDWFECRQHQTILVDYPLKYPKEDRSFSGSQMGRKAAFKNILPMIDDDYLYRNEDMIFAELIEREGYEYGRIGKVFHYHQMMNKKSQWQRTINNVNFDIDLNRKEENRIWIMQAKGLIKYTNPTKKYLIYSVQTSVYQLKLDKDFNFKAFRKWVADTNPKWLPHIESIKLSIKQAIMGRLLNVLKKIYRYIIK